MAITKLVSKKSVQYGQEKLHIITFNLVIMDGATEVINQDFTCEFRQGESSAQKVAEIIDKMQICIDRYKAEQVIFNSAGLNNAVTSIQGGLVL